MRKQPILKLCPFCGGEAELDSQRGFCSFPEGDAGIAVAIYCLKCSADMSLCLQDYPEMSVDELINLLVENWNRRTPES